MRLVKIFAAIMSMMLLLSSAALAEFADVKGTRYEQAVNTLAALGLVEGGMDGAYNPEKTINKAEFAAIIVRMIMGGDSFDGEAEDSGYRDVTNAHWASGYISAVSKMGLMSGDKDGYFMPENELLFGQAVKTVVTLLGYNLYAENSGGYPAGYLSVASANKITRGINLAIDQPVTRGNAALLLYNALNVDLITQDGFGDKLTLSKQKGRTVLSEYMKISKLNGLVQAVGKTMINGIGSLPNDEVQIDDVLYSTKGIDAAPYIGQQVEYYVKDDETAGKSVILYMQPKDGANNIIEVADRNISPDSDNRVLKYWIDEDKGDILKADISPNANVIYNGQYVCKAINAPKEYFNPKTGQVRLIDNNNDGNYEICIISSYDICIARSVNAEEGNIYFKFNEPSIDVGLNDSSVSCTIFKNGKRATIKDIKEWDVLAVAVSDNKKVINIYDSDSSVIGRVTEKDDEYATITSTINGEEKAVSYRISPLFHYNSDLSPSSNILDTKVSGTFYFDAWGNLATVDTSSVSNKLYGFMVKIAADNGINNTVSMKIFTAKGTMQIFQIADNITLDGVSGKKGTDVINTFNSLSKEVKNGLITYVVNSEGKISEIDTVMANVNPSKDELKLSYSGTNTYYQSVPGFFIDKSYKDPFKYGIDDNTVIFAIPQSPTSDSDYAVYSKAYFKNENSYPGLLAYNLSDFNIAKAIIIPIQSGYANTSAISESDDPLSLVTGISNGIDKYGNQVAKISVLSEGKAITLTLDLSSGNSKIVQMNGSISNVTQISISDLKPGDIIFYDADPKNRAGLIVRVNAKAMADVTPNDYNVNAVSSYTERALGYAYAMDGSLLMVNVGTANILYNINKANIYVMDLTVNRAHMGSLSSIIASKNQSEASMVFVRCRFGNTKEIIVYKKS